MKSSKKVTMQQKPLIVRKAEGQLKSTTRQEPLYAKEYQDIVDNAQKEALYIIEDYFKKNFKYDKKTLNEVIQSAIHATKEVLRKRYVFHEPTIHTGHLLYSVDEDFKDWFITVGLIPLYQTFGDTLGYYNGNWEFNYHEKVGPEYVNELIYEFISLGGINDISIVGWKASDDTILYMTTYQVLLKGTKDANDFGKKLSRAYIDTIPMMENRDPGITTMQNLNIQKNIAWDQLPYDSSAIGAGSAMRSGCIGIFFPGQAERERLIAYAVECSRITHNSAIAILGSITSALFTSFAIERIGINIWPHLLMKIMKSDDIDQYMKKSRPHEYHLYVRDKTLFIGQWEKYLTLRFSGLNPKMDQKIFKNPVTRFEYFTSNFSKGHEDFPGSCGDDATIMAYDALLESSGVIEKLIVYAILHPGDSDTIGSIAFSWFGAYFHSPRNQRIIGSKMEKLEFFQEIIDMTNADIKKMLRIYYYDIFLDAFMTVINR
jgi:ADP-ribosylglycohydrolase